MAMNTVTATPTAASEAASREAGTSNLLIRAVMASAALLLAAAVIYQGAVSLMTRVRPEQAARLAPGNARVAVEAARAASERGVSPSAARLRNLVRTALSRDPTLTTAIEYRAVEAEQSGDRGRAARLFHLSDAISRRSLPTRLWLIQDAVNRGDVIGALGQFDIALRTSTAAPDVLFPVLAGATSDPALAAPIARMLDRPSDWRAMFLHYAIVEAGAAHDMARVMLHMRDRAMLRQSKSLDSLIGQLVAERDFATARVIDDAFQPKRPAAGLVRDGRFADPAAPFPFGWGLADTGKAGAMRSLVGERPVLAYQAFPGGDGQVALQLLTLPAGRYRFSAIEAAAAIDAASPGYWTITCGEENGPQIAIVDQAVKQGASVSVDFTVPPGCDGQWLAFTVRLSDAPQGQRGSIASVSVDRR